MDAIENAEINNLTVGDIPDNMNLCVPQKICPNFGLEKQPSITNPNLKERVFQFEETWCIDLVPGILCMYFYYIINSACN